jgi:hypothetical protein
MKHIKLFETFNDKYYQKIEVYEYDNLLGIGHYDEEESLRRRVTDVEFNKLKKLFSDRRCLPYRVDDDGWEDESGNGVYVDASYDDKKSINIWIDGLEDDWYLVSDSDGPYKCDQWDGLMKLLNDKGYLNPNKDITNETYNPIKEAFSEDDYYKEIDFHEFSEAKIISLPQSMEDRIRSILINGYKIERIGSAGITISSYDAGIDGLWSGDWHIFLMDDDWFLVDTEFSEGDVAFFKCDQWDGLMRLLKRYKVVS